MAKSSPRAEGERFTEALARLNQNFYQSHGHAFDRTRRGPWQGWETLLHRTSESLRSLRARGEALRILDLGCGNGRFYGFLRDRLTGPLVYRGIDQSPVLIEHARERYGRDECRFEVGDVLHGDYQCDEHATGSLPHPSDADADSARGFDLVVCFGVFHHVATPGARRALFQTLLDRRRSGGLAVASFWHFMRDARIAARALPLDQPLPGGVAEALGSLGRTLASQAADHAESGDFLLPWGGASDEPTALRYCHDVSAFEIAELEALCLGPAGEAVAPLTVERFVDDGRRRDLNEYLVIRAPG